MNKKTIIIILAVLGICLLMAGPVSAKEKVKVKITTDDSIHKNMGNIVITLVDSHGHEIKSKGTIHYNVTDENGHYEWAYKSYNGKVRLEYSKGTYKVDVKFDGDSKYAPVRFSKVIIVTGSNLNEYYYDDHNWGLDQQVDDYFDDNYWDEDLYDDPFTYDGEGP